MKKSKKILKTFISVISVFVLILSAGYVIPLTEKVDFSPVKNASDWMSEIDGGTALGSIKIPGTHDSATKYVQLAFFSKCQALGIREQLECGFRYLDIRLGATGDKLMLMHGFTKCKTGSKPWSKPLFLDDVLNQCYEFLEKHPEETVIFAVKKEHEAETVSRFQTILNNYISQNENRWLLTDRVPDLNSARGKLVLMRRYEDEAKLGKRSGIPLIWKNQSGNDNPAKSFEEESIGEHKLFVQDRYEYGTDDKWAAFNSGINKYNDAIENGAVCINFLSTKGTAPIGHPYFYAKKLNKLITNADTGEYGWIIVDFADSSTAFSVFGGNK